MLTVSGVSKSHGTRVLFRDVSVQVPPGRRVALVGPNGTGKTTLLEILAGTQQPDEGEVSRSKDLAVGYLRQDVAETLQSADHTGPRTQTAVEAVVAGGSDIRELESRLRSIEAQLAESTDDEQQQALLAEYGKLHERFEHAGGYTLEAEARRLLAGLGFAAEDLEREAGQLSGGWMMRVVLARLLLSAPDVLLLDEPTNHLDLASVTWLEEFLAEYAGAVVLVSHDRDFINGIVNRVVELSGGTATEYAGNYADFVTQRAQRMEQLEGAARNQQRKIAQTERFIERFRYKASKARQVQSRVKQLERVERVELPVDSTPRLRFRFPPPPRGGREVIRLEQVTRAFGPKVVYRGLDLVLERGQKAALVGPNGAGKSTLLKLLAGALAPDAGRRVLGHNVSVAYFAQHQIEALDLDRTVLEELSGAVDTSAVNPRSMLGAFLFSGDDVNKRVGVLSGGEKSRLALAKLLSRPANLLCMDEPTNHLDIASRDVLEDALVEYPGTVVLITHDRHLIRSVADTIIDVGDGRATVHPGDYEYYLDRTGGAAAEAGVDPAPAGDGSPRPAAAQKRAEAERRNRIYRETKELRRRLEQVERALGGAEADVAALTRQLADPAVYGDAEQVKQLVARHNEAKDRAVALTDEWERLYVAVEEATARAAGDGQAVQAVAE